jgi:hypothetical protein
MRGALVRHGRALLYVRHPHHRLATGLPAKVFSLVKIKIVLKTQKKIKYAKFIDFHHYLNHFFFRSNLFG